MKKTENITTVINEEKAPVNLEINTENRFAAIEQTIQQVVKAQKIYRSFSQKQVDEIFRKAAFAASANRIRLARMAVEETGMGVIEDKVIKNQFASEYIYNKYKDEKTVGLIEEDHTFGIRKYAEPVGV
ncbi:MAG TPA: hypothetical protein PKN21_11860, partial [Bacteroidales bacterium]|nr:hypothetical protein [Bacteroidales bacterium]